MRRAFTVGLMAVVVLAAWAVRTWAAENLLTVEDLAKDGRWMARSVRISHWSDDGRTLYFRMQGKTRTDPEELYAVEPSKGKPKLVSQAEDWKALPPAFDNFGEGWFEMGRLLSPDWKQRLAVKDRKLYLIDMATGSSRQLTNTSDGIISPRFVMDGKGVCFQRGDNLYVLSLEAGALIQVTDFRKGPKPKEPGEEESPKTEQEKWLKQQQRDLFKYFQRLKEDRDRANARRKEREKVLAEPEPCYVPEGKEARSPFLSPDGKCVVFTLVEPAKDVKSTIVPRYVTESGFVEAPPSRPKVGENLEKSQLALYRVADGQVTILEVPGDKMELGFSEPIWSRDGQKCLVPAGSMDSKHRVILGLDTETAKLHMVHDYYDSAWVDGPMWWLVGWMPDDERVYFVCEADGWAHLYTVSYDGCFCTQLTSGQWEVRGVQLSRDGKNWYLITSQDGPGILNLYKMPIDGGKLTKLTGAVEGIGSFLLSPDEKWLAVTTSKADRPYDVTLIALSGSAKPRTITSQATKEFLSRTWITPKLVQIPDGHGGIVYGHLWMPPKPAEPRPAVISVHGAGYAQSVAERWGSGPFLSANYLGQRGYYLLDLDYLGSGGYGRACRVSVYRSMGGADADSCAAAAEWLVKEHGVDPKRIGIYGGSYGGFLTLAALFNKPGVFAGGIAMYSVTDWAHYNHWYTSRILNIPATDEEAYKASSPIYHCENLQDRLLIVIGLVDDNVHVQDTFRLMQRLIEQRKTGWDVAIYPVEGHGVGDEDGRWDLLTRMFAFWDQVLKGKARATE